MQEKTVKICIAIPTKLYIHATTILSLLKSIQIPGFVMEIRLLPGKSNIDQARSILVTRWYDSADDDDLFMFIDSDQTFTSDDILSLTKLKSDVAVGIYSSLNDYPTCRPKNYQKFIRGEDNDLYYGATGFMMIRKPILKKIEDFIKLENMGRSRFWISHDNRDIIPFFKQRLIESETIPSDKPIPEWLGEDYSFCWMARRVGGSVKCHISPTIGHMVPKLVYFYPNEYKSKKWDEKTIVYYTGASKIQWSPKILNKKGLGGSETAVVYLTKYWQSKGYKVFVYGNVIEGKYDDVEYIDYRKFSKNDNFNIIILWRAFGFSVLDKLKAKQVIVDLHDEPSPTYQFLLNHINKVDKILVKSNYHKELFPSAIHNKFITLQNGMTDSYLNIKSDNIKKNKYKLVYCSSYDRGLVEMLKYGWPLIRVNVPEAELHICYGMELLSEDKKKELIPLLKQKGIFEYGKISHTEVMKMKLESSIHYYIGGISEIDCISVKESVLAGCIPVVSNNNVFKERDYCLKVDGAPLEANTHIKGAKLIINLLKDDKFYKESLEKVQKGKSTIKSWEEIGNEWVNKFIN